MASHRIQRPGVLPVLLLLLAPVAYAQPGLKELQPKIDDAINRGVDALLRWQEKDGTWAGHEYAYPVGPTALCVYTLIKCGLPTSHPGVARGLRFLEQHRSEKTYGVACQLMALEAAHDEKYKPIMKDLLSRLVEWEKSGYGYPGSAVDMSNSQYAALGFRAAAMAGLKIPREPLMSLASAAMAHQEKPHEEKLPTGPVKDPEGYARSNTAKVAGFSYRKNGKCTGSMTTAGLGILIICKDLLGKRAPKRVRSQMDRSIERGLLWMRRYWRIDGNPPDGRGWPYYYLYGLERVGDLLRREILEGHYWYREGSDFIVKKQNRGEGSWGGSPDTCFALLFLKRATWAGGVTNAGGSGRTNRVYLAAADGNDVRLRAAGNPKLSIWIDGFNEKRLKRRFPWARGEKGGVRVASVSYLLNGEVIHTAKGDGASVWKGEPFSYRHVFKQCGRYSVACRVEAKVPHPRNGEAETVILESPLLLVEVRDLPDPKADEIQGSLAKNPLTKRLLGVEHSSSQQRRPPADLPYWVLDGRLSTAWLCKADDETAELKLTFKRGFRMRYLTIWPAFRPHGKTGENTWDDIEELEVEYNRMARPRIVKVTGRPGEPIKIDLRRRVDLRSLRFRILKRKPTKHRKGMVGIAEIVAR